MVGFANRAPAAAWPARWAGSAEQVNQMAIPPSYLSDLIGGIPLPRWVYIKLRIHGCLSPTASESEVCQIVREAINDSRRETEQQGFTWASWETRLPSKLWGLLNAKGRDLAEPFRRKSRDWRDKA
jgi:hypothetical protein